MDVIDIMLARALTPQGQIDTYARKSAIAVQQANEAISNIESITEQTNTNNANSLTTLNAANAALDAAQEAQEQLESALDTLQAATSNQIDTEIDKLAFQLIKTNTSTVVNEDLKVTYPSGNITNINSIVKMYKSTGTNEDGTMTQKAISNAINDTKVYIDQKISNATIINNGGTTNLDSENAGSVVVVGDDGNIIAGDITEEDLISLLIKSGNYTVDDTVGLIVDYENKSYERTQDAVGYTMGENFNKYAMYGGRMRCNVADDGTINAFYGDLNYKEDGSNGQVMVYQPKFYYQRTTLKTESISAGLASRKESLILSATPRAGFTLHPLFINSAGQELEYVLFSAYEGSVYDMSEETYFMNDDGDINFSDDKLSSIAGVKPVTGLNNVMTLPKMQLLARNRGTGWQLTTIEFESANQMLEMVEFGTMNGQSALEKGVVNINKTSGANCSAITGSTASLGNSSGAASSTIVDSDGVKSTYDITGKRAISYRGLEQPWGNIWRLISNVTLRGGSNSVGGIPYYNEQSLLSFHLPSASATYISSIGIDNNYNWIYLPIECNSTANSALPIGDALWTLSALNGENLLAIGGLCNSGEGAGPFHYAGDISLTTELRYFNGRLMFVPVINTIYENNITKWHVHYGG